MQYLSVFLPVAAMVSGALASPAWGAGSSDACLAAVTGSAALGDGGLRASHCKSYLATTVTPIVTETVYITGKGNDNWKRATVAYCPNEVPNYASACDDAHYTSACSRFGFTDVITTTVAPTTTTKTIWVKPTGGAGASCTSATVTVGGATTVTSTTTATIIKDGSLTWSATTVTVSVATPTTVTVTKDGSLTYSATTVTVTNTDTVTKDGSVTYSATTLTVTDTATCSSSSVAATKCNVDDALATQLVTNFVNLLEHTSYAGNPAFGIPAGSGYNQDVSDATLAKDFIDISDSINFMSGVALGAVSFDSKAAFDDTTNGQGAQPEVSVNVLNIWHDCDSVTWRWSIFSTAFPVNGISYFTVNDDKLIQKNWVEFDNGAWLQSFGQNCSFASPNAPAVVSPPASKRGLLTL